MDQQRIQGVHCGYEAGQRANEQCCLSRMARRGGNHLRVLFKRISMWIAYSQLNNSFLSSTWKSSCWFAVGRENLQPFLGEDTTGGGMTRVALLIRWSSFLEQSGRDDTMAYCRSSLKQSRTFWFGLWGWIIWTSLPRISLFMQSENMRSQLSTRNGIFGCQDV